MTWPDNEAYAEFKRDILENKLLPLAGIKLSKAKAPIPTDIQQHALMAIAVYPAYDILPFVESPSAFILAYRDVPNFDAVLSSLIQHEVQHMRRSVFKGTGIEVGGKGVESQDLSDSYLKRGWNDIASFLIPLWDTESEQQRQLSPTVRNAVATASLYCSSEILNRLLRRSVGSEFGNVVESLYQRMLDTVLADITADESIILKLDAVSPWTAFFSTFLEPLVRNRVQMWLRAENEFMDNSKMSQAEIIATARERIVVGLLDELVQRRFVEASIPQVRSNLLMAGSGMSEYAFDR